MAREKLTWLPVLFCLFLAPCWICARSLADEVKKENKRMTGARVLLGIASAGGLVASSVQFYKCVPKDNYGKVEFCGIGFIASLFGILYSFDPLIERYIDPYVDPIIDCCCGKQKEKVVQKNQPVAKKELKVAPKSEKKKKLRKRIREFFALKKY